jgi:hypothetical protein
VNIVNKVDIANIHPCRNNITMHNLLRVHIAPVGFDPVQRITAPLIDQRADRVYLVSRSKKDDPASSIVKQVEATLAKHPSIEVKHVYTEIWDLFSCLEKYRDVFTAEKGNHLYVNVSTGSKILSIAGMLSCMLWKGIPYYARLDYEQGGPEIKTGQRNVTGTEALPVYQINMPSPESLNVLAIIGSKRDGKISKKELIEELQKIHLIPVFPPSQPRNAPHSRLRAILDPLETHWQFIHIKSRGRRSEVSLTEQGRSALRIFGQGGMSL